MAYIQNLLQKNILCIPGRLDRSDATHSVLFSHCNPSHRILEYYSIPACLAYSGWWFCRLNYRTDISFTGFTICVAGLIFRSNAGKSDPPFLKKCSDLLLYINTFMDMHCSLLPSIHSLLTKGEIKDQDSSPDNCNPGDLKYFCIFRFIWPRSGLS